MLRIVVPGTAAARHITDRDRRRAIERIHARRAYNEAIELRLVPDLDDIDARDYAPRCLPPIVRTDGYGGHCA